MFKKQGWHFLSMVVSLVVLSLIVDDEFLSGALWGVSTGVWFWLAVAVPIVHQIVVPVFWRAELYHKWMTKTFGARAFFIYKVIFTILFVGRPLSIIFVGIANKNTLPLNPFLAYGIAFLLFLPAAYGMYSVIRYFGIDRAYGIDHFEPEIYRNKPFVKEGMFKYSNNVMYTYIFLVLWALALAFLSRAALLVAIFNHVYIWVHFYFTELPDIKYIYAVESE